MNWRFCGFVFWCHEQADKVYLQKWFQKHGKGVSVLEMGIGYYAYCTGRICESLNFPAHLSYVLGSLLIWNCWILNIECLLLFLKPGAVKKSKQIFKNLATSQNTVGRIKLASQIWWQSCLGGKIRIQIFTTFSGKRQIMHKHF